MGHVFERYDFLFLRDYQIAAQLAAFIGNKPKAFHYISLAAADGWKIAAIKKIKLFRGLRTDPEWRSFVLKYSTCIAGICKG